MAVAASQMRAVLSPDAVTMRDPSGLKAAEFTHSHGRAGPRSPWRSRRPRCGRSCPADAVTMRDPSGLKAAEVTASSWPRRTAISLAVAASQMRAVLSHDAVTMRDPSGLKAADFTGSVMATESKTPIRLRDSSGERGSGR